jgi:hypothetical protein
MNSPSELDGAADALILVEARWRVHETLTTDLSALSIDLLERGFQSDALWELACTDASDLPWQGPPLFESALRELGHGRMTVQEAALIVARADAAEMLAGAISGRRLAARVSALAIALDYPEPLMALYGLDDEYNGGWGRTEADLDVAAREAADRLLGNG